MLTCAELRQKHGEVISARREAFSLTDTPCFLGNHNVGCIHTLARTERQRRSRRAAALVLITAPVSLFGENNGRVRLWSL